MKVRKIHHFAFIAMILVLLISGCSMLTGSDDASSTENSSTAANAAKILSNLGVSTSTTALKTTSTQGTEVTISDPASWNPLKHEYAVFSPKAEVLQIGVGNNSYYNALYEDGDASYTGSAIFTDDGDWEASSPKASCAADLDGDGIDEFVIFALISNTIEMSVYHDGSPSELTEVADVSWDSPLPTAQSTTMDSGTAMIYSRWLKLAAADLDGDGIDEILYAQGANAYILEIDADGSSSSVLESNSYGTAVNDIAAGDCDGDGEDEFLVCLYGSSGYALYDSTFDDPLTSPEFSAPNSSALLTEGCFGDFDGDNIDEICVAQSLASSVRAYTYEYADGILTQAEEISTNYLAPSTIGFRLCPSAVDIDGDGSDELFLCNTLFNNVLTSSSAYVNLETPFQLGYFSGVSIGDVDGDAAEDLIFLVGADKGNWTVRAYGKSSSGDWKTLTLKYDYCHASSEEGLMFSSTIVAGNVDEDSNRVKYIGHELQYTTPTVIAVLASVPYYADVAEADSDYDYTNWVTTFGRSTTSTATSSSTVGFSVGVTVEAEQDFAVFGVKIASFKASASFSSSTSWEWTTSSSLSKSVTYSCAGGNDRVIFTSVPMDVYTYEVVDSDSGDEGNEMYIKVPRDYSIYSVTRTFYNANNGDLPDVILSHTIGSPSTYPSEEDMEDLLDEYGGYENGPESVAQGESSNDNVYLEISVASGEGTTVSTDFTSEASVGAGAGGVTVSATLGFNTGFAYTTSTESGTTFGGTVGFLPSAYYENVNYNYSSGLFVYPFPDSESLQTYWIVDYWVE